MADDTLFSSKDRERYNRMKATLANGGSPFEKYSRVNPNANSELLKLSESTRETIKPVKVHVESHVWSEITVVDPNWTPDLTPRCIANCGAAIDFSTCVYVKLLIEFIKRRFEGVRTIETSNKGSRVEEYRSSIKLPMFNTGPICKSCFDRLYASKWTDLDGNVHRVAEPINLPRNTTTETFRKGHRTITKTVPVEHIERTESEVRGNKNITPELHLRVYSEPDADVIEEWVIKPEKAIPEPVDSKAFRHFSSGSNHPAYCGCHKCKHKE